MMKNKSNDLVYKFLFSCVLTLFTPIIVFSFVSYSYILIWGSPDDGVTRFGVGTLAAYISFPIICIIVVSIWIRFKKYRMQHSKLYNEEEKNNVWHCPKCNETNLNNTYVCNSCKYSLT